MDKIKDIENVINKINIYIKKHEITLHQFANSVGHNYQTLYRLLNNHFLPSMASLQTIAKYFNCTISELTNDNIFIDIPLYENFDEFKAGNSINHNIRIYLPYQIFLPIYDREFFAIKNSLSQVEQKYQINDLDIILNTNCCQIFYKTNQITLDGNYYVTYQSDSKMLNVLSVSRSSVIVNVKGAINHLSISEIIPIAYYINTAFFPDYKTGYLDCIPIDVSI